MQLEQQENFTIHGPQLEILGEVETKLPTPAKKHGTASIVLVALALVSVLGIGGAKLKGVESRAVSSYSAMCTTNSGRTDAGRLAQAANDVVTGAGQILGEDNDLVRQAQQAVNAYVGDISRTAPTVQSEMVSAVELAYKTAQATTDKENRKEMDLAHDEFVSYQNIIVREYLTEYNKCAAILDSTAFPTAQLGALWGVNTLPRFTLMG